jgi:KUP system potassium uptake protein
MSTASSRWSSGRSLIVSVKQLMFILRADNDGEGGILSLAYLTRGCRQAGEPALHARHVARGVRRLAVLRRLADHARDLGALGGRGSEGPGPGLSDYVLPIGVSSSRALRRSSASARRRWGASSARDGRLVPDARGARDPAHPGRPARAHGALAAPRGRLRLPAPVHRVHRHGCGGAAVTGAEALYADMGHFGRVPIVRAWFFLVFPCLTINYLGQAQQILHHPETAPSPFFHLAPDWPSASRWSCWPRRHDHRQPGGHLGGLLGGAAGGAARLPARLTVRQTSEHESGQIYIAVVNWAALRRGHHC